MALTRGIDRQALQVTDLAGDAGHREPDDRPFNGDRPGMGERRGVHDVGEGGAVVAPNGSEGADIDANSGIEVPSTQRPDALFPPAPAVLLERALEEREFVDATEPGREERPDRTREQRTGADRDGPVAPRRVDPRPHVGVRRNHLVIEQDEVGDIGSVRPRADPRSDAALCPGHLHGADGTRAMRSDRFALHGTAPRWTGP